jgi:hypothetical protein
LFYAAGTNREMRHEKGAIGFRLRYADNTKTVEDGSLCDASIKVAKFRNKKTMRKHKQVLRTLMPRLMIPKPKKTQIRE